MRSILLAMFLVSATPAICADDELSMFDSRGKATAYIADDLTIYLWSGKPVAYLDQGSGVGGLHIYGFNGKHLGWFVKGVAWDHDGNAACAVQEVLRTTEFEPFKGFKEFKAFKSFKEFAPLRPALTSEWSDIPCRLFLAQGAQ